MRPDSLRPWIALAALVSLAATACTPSPSAPGLQLAGDPLVPWDEGRSIVRLSTLPPARGDVSGYELERRLLPDGVPERVPFYAPAATGDPLSPDHVWVLFPSELWHRFEPGAVNGASYEFRLRALPDPSGTRLSAPVVVVLEPAPPIITADVVGGVPRLSLVNRSSRATTLEIFRTRGACDAWEPTGTTTTVDAGTTAWLDPTPADYRDGGNVAYEVRAVAGALRSRARRATVRGLRTPPVVSATATATGVDVSIAGRSRCPLDVAAYSKGTMSDSNQTTLGAARIPPAPGLPLVIAAPPAAIGGTVYWIEGADLEARVAPARPGTWLLSPPDPASLVQAEVGIPTAVAAALLPSGALAWIDHLRVSVDGAQGPISLAVTPYDLGNWGARLIVDAEGAPHVLMNARRQMATESVSDLVHLWFDGTGWQQELVVDGSTSSTTSAITNLFLTLGADGVLVAAWTEGASGYRVARRAPAGWDTQSIPGIMWDIGSIAGDAAGAIHFLTMDGRYWTDAGGAWTFETITRDMGYGEIQAFAGGLVVAYTAPDGTLSLTTRELTGWGPPQPLPDYPSGRYRLTPIIRSADGKRLAWAAAGAARLWLLDEGGITSWPWYDASEVAGVVFGPGGRLSVLTKASSGPSIRFEEP